MIDFLLIIIYQKKLKYIYIYYYLNYCLSSFKVEYLIFKNNNNNNKRKKNYSSKFINFRSK